MFQILSSLISIYTLYKKPDNVLKSTPPYYLLLYFMTLHFHLSNVARSYACQVSNTLTWVLNYVNAKILNVKITHYAVENE